MRSAAVAFSFFILLSRFGIPGRATAQPAPALKAGGATVTASLRTRVEIWDWFRGGADNDYAFSGSILRFGLTGSHHAFEWQAEFAVPVLLGLPDDAIAPGAQGQLGLGASYFAANDGASNAAMLFPKQVFIRFRDPGGLAGHSLKVGRMEFIDGAEISPRDASLAALKRDRIAHRLLGNFGFSHVGRSFDAVQYAIGRPNLNVTLFAGRPTRGVFQVDGWGGLNTSVFYGAMTGQIAGKSSASEWRVFGLGYSDYRDRVLKTDNRPLAVRAADDQRIHLGSYGGHALHVRETRAGRVDLLFWGVLQNGSWGRQAHRAGAFAAEAGWQPRFLTAVRPWLRGGVDYGSGDGDPGDQKHGSFFQVLPTPRIYARFPFFNMMNNRDAFAELILRPTSALTIRVDVHSLALANRNDLWYLGGGAFQPWTFGYVGRPSNGRTGLATLYDASIEYAANAHLSIAGYYGYAAGRAVVPAIYPPGKNGSFGYLEASLRL